MAVLCCLLLLACWFDYRRQRIPNLLTAAMLAVGLLRASQGGGGEMWHFCLRMAAVALALFLFFQIGSIGAGDVKLFAVCAGYFPGKKVLWFLFYSMLLSAAISLIKMWHEKNAGERFCRLGEYLAEVARTGRLKRYICDRRELGVSGICLSGPAFISALMHWGGVY